MEMFKINVLMTTFNVEKYVKTAIESVLCQQTTYRFNLIIVDDCSTDSTVEIVRSIQKLHPYGHLISLHQNPENLGVVQNSKKIFGLAKARYIAMCDGDDFWTNKNKLQKQCEFLENNDDFNSVVGKTIYINQESGFKKEMRDGWNKDKRTVYNLSHYLKSPFSQTSSYFFRNNFSFPDWFDELQSNDATLFCLATNSGKIKYFKENFSIYRIHKENYSAKKTALRTTERTEFFLNKINQYTDYKYNSIIKIRKIINSIYYIRSHFHSKVAVFFLSANIGILFLISKYFFVFNQNSISNSVSNFNYSKVKNIWDNEKHTNIIDFEKQVINL